MAGSWISGLKNEYMCKSKKELVEEIMCLKAEAASRDISEHQRERAELFAVAFEIESLRKSNAQLSEESEKYKRMYADELQKRLELAALVNR